MFDSPACAGVSGTLCVREGQGDIGFAAFPPHAASIEASHWNVCGVPLRMPPWWWPHVTGDSLAPINAQYYTTPFGPPVLQVAGMHHAFLADQAARHTPVQLVSRYRREAVDSFNIAAHAASGTSVPPIAVVTPHRLVGIHRRAAGGMVAWLAALHAAGQLQRAGQLTRDVRAWATCGHELGHLGLQDLLHRQRPLITSAHYCLHLGANLGGAGTLTLRVRAVGRCRGAAHARSAGGGRLSRPAYPRGTR